MFDQTPGVKLLRRVVLLLRTFLLLRIFKAMKLVEARGEGQRVDLRVGLTEVRTAQRVEANAEHCIPVVGVLGLLRQFERFLRGIIELSQA